MTLVEELLAESHPSEPQYQPRTEFDGEGGYIQTGPLTTRPEDEQILRDFGYSPDEVTIIGSPHISRWQQRSAVREDGIRTGEYETVWLASYKFMIAPKPCASMPDIEALVLKARGGPGKPATAPDPHWFVFQAGDQQVGKRSREGATEAIVERYLESVEGAREEFKRFKRFGIEGVQICMPGDCLEGNQSQGGRNNGWLTDLTITEQVKVFRRLLYHTVERLAPLAERCIVTVVGGNHDEADRQLNIWPGNNWATHTAEAVAERLADRPEVFGHVEMVTPDKWRGAVATQVGDTVVGVVHGHQWSRDKGFDWLMRQAINRHPVGGAQVVQSGHWHEFAVRSNRHVTMVQSPTFEVASDYLIDKRGSTAKRGAAVYLMRSGEVSRLSIV